MNSPQAIQVPAQVAPGRHVGPAFCAAQQTSMRALKNDVLPDLLRPGMALVFCGTAAGKRSAQEGAYYAHPGNLFWRALYQCGLTPRLFLPQEYPLLPALGIGLTDLAKHHSGNDNELPAGAFDPQQLRMKIERHAPRVLAFTSKNAARIAIGTAVAYGLQAVRFGDTALFVLPSPSGQARGHWTIEPWLQLAALTRVGNGTSRGTPGT